ncbi:MAG: ribosome silencing factor [Gemmatimonadota bacterium]
MAEATSARLPVDVQTVVDAIDDRKGQKILVLDLRHLSNAADYFIIASGTSDAHVRGLADGVMRAMLADGHRTHGVEGLQTGRWVLLDFVDVVVHLFHPETRAFYQLERLWQDAPALLSGP